MHNLASRLWRVTPDKIWDLATQFREVEILFTYFKTRANSDSKTKAELLEEVDARFECCRKLYEKLLRNGTVSVKNLQRRIELKRQRAEISATRKRDLAKAKAAAEASDAEARFRFEEARLEAEKNF